MSDPVRLLLLNGGLQLLFASLVGWVMLVPMQPWARSVAEWKVFSSGGRKSLGAAHIDWMMLAFMQGLAALLLERFQLANTATTRIAAWLLVYGGWTNPLAYVFRAWGVNAFVLAGPPRQRLAAALVGSSSLAITVAWAMLVGCAAFARTT